MLLTSLLIPFPHPKHKPYFIQHPDTHPIMHVEHMAIPCTTLVHRSIQYPDKTPNDRAAVPAVVENLTLRQCL